MIKMLEIHMPVDIELIRMVNGELKYINKQTEDSLQIIRGNHDIFYFIFNRLNVLIPIGTVLVADVSGELTPLSENIKKDIYFVSSLLNKIIDINPKFVPLKLYTRIDGVSLKEYKDMYFENKNRRNVLEENVLEENVLEEK